MSSDDIFRRQRELRGWHQDEISSRSVLILGVGGVGCHAAIGCARLGFKRLIVVDFDTVDLHNLNRQLLYGRKDVGARKVEVAARVLKDFHATHPEFEIESLHANVLTHWGAVVEMMRRADVVLNSIDHGDLFDMLVCEAGARLGVPVVDGGTEPHSGHGIMIDTYDSREAGRPTWYDLHDVSAEHEAVVRRVKTEDVLAMTDVSFIPADPMPEAGGSTVVSASTVGQWMAYVACRLVGAARHAEKSVPSRLFIMIPTFEVESFSHTPPAAAGKEA